MRIKILTIFCLCLLYAGRASAQWAVIDPSNIAQSIINTSKNVAHTSTTATNMVKNFQETVKIYEQGKKYYDALKSVNNLVKDARKVQQTILMVGDITDIYVNSFQKMMRDENFTVEELGAIAFGYTKLLEESNDVLTELKNVVNITTLSMTDKERMDVVERCLEMTVCGSIARARDKGGIIFADLRDTTGILQLVFDEDKIGRAHV